MPWKTLLLNIAVSAGRPFPRNSLVRTNNKMWLFYWCIVYVRPFFYKFSMSVLCHKKGAHPVLSYYYKGCYNKAISSVLREERA